MFGGFSDFGKIASSQISETYHILWDRHLAKRAKQRDEDAGMKLSRTKPKGSKYAETETG